MMDERKDRATRAIIWMGERIAEGRNVYLTQYASRIEITPKLWARFERPARHCFAHRVMAFISLGVNNGIMLATTE